MASSSVYFHFFLLLLPLLLLRDVQAVRSSFFKTVADTPPQSTLDQLNQPSFAQESELDNRYGINFDEHNPSPPTPTTKAALPDSLPPNYNPFAYVTSVADEYKTQTKPSSTPDHPNYYYYHSIADTQTPPPPPPSPPSKGLPAYLPSYYYEHAHFTPTATKTSEVEDEGKKETEKLPSYAHTTTYSTNKDYRYNPVKTSPPPPARHNPPPKLPWNFHPDFYVTMDEPENYKEEEKTKKTTVHPSYYNPKNQERLGMSDTRSISNQKYYQNSNYYDTTEASHMDENYYDKNTENEEWKTKYYNQRETTLEEEDLP